MTEELIQHDPHAQHEESMKETWSPEDGADREAAIYQAIGAASTCWENMSGAGVFDDRRAKAIGEGLIAHLNSDESIPDDMPNAGVGTIECHTAHLGLASNHELIMELMARSEVSREAGKAWPNYTAVKGT